MSNDLDLNLLRALNALLLTQSVSASARRLGVTQPAMSASLRRLRLHFGDPILVRRGNQMLPTPLAERLLSSVGEAMEAVRRALRPEDAEFEPGDRAMSVCIATTDDVICVLGPALMQYFKKRAPGVRLSMQTLNSRYNLSALELGEVDVAITVDWQAPEQLRRRPLYVDKFVVVLPKQHPMAAQRLTARRFAASKHLLVAPFGGKTGPLDKALAKCGLAREITLCVPNFALVPVLLRDRPELVCTMPELAARRLFADQEVVLQRPPFQLDPLRFEVYWHLRSQRDPVHRWIRGALVEVSAALT